VLDEHLPREKKVGSRERTTSSGSSVFMKHQSSQLELFSNRRRRSKAPPSKTEARQAPPPTRRSSHVPHATRPDAHGNLHIVWRIARGLPGLRTPRALRRLERAFRLGKQREGFALIHYSIQQGRVGPGRCRPGPPTDPDVRNSRIRLLGLAGSLRAAEDRVDGVGRRQAVALFECVPPVPVLPPGAAGATHQPLPPEQCHRGPKLP